MFVFRNRSKSRWSLGGSAIIAAICMCSSTQAFAQTDSGASAPQAADAQNNESGFPDIVVTATKRETNLQSTPIEITAVMIPPMISAACSSHTRTSHPRFSSARCGPVRLSEFVTPSSW